MLSVAERKEHRLIASRRWKLTHRMEVHVYSSEYNRTHSEQQKAYHKAHPKKNKGRGTWRAWRLAHPEEQRKLKNTDNNHRRARKYGLPDTLTASQWQAICAVHDYRCVYCGKKAKLTMDHVLPLSKGGGTIAFNIVPACLPCNSSKGTRLPPKPVKLALGI